MDPLVVIILALILVPLAIINRIYVYRWDIFLDVVIFSVIMAYFFVTFKAFQRLYDKVNRSIVYYLYGYYFFFMLGFVFKIGMLAKDAVQDISTFIFLLIATSMILPLYILLLVKLKLYEKNLLLKMFIPTVIYLAIYYVCRFIVA